jgi:hypothetical protein
MSDDLVARLCSPEETVFPAGTKIVLDDGKTMELLEPFSMWSSSSDKTDAAVEIVLLRVENDHLKQARSDALAGGDALRDEITRLRARVEVLERALRRIQATPHPSVAAQCTNCYSHQKTATYALEDAAP